MRGSIKFDMPHDCMWLYKEAPTQFNFFHHHHEILISDSMNLKGWALPVYEYFFSSDMQKPTSCLYDQYTPAFLGVCGLIEELIVRGSWSWTKWLILSKDPHLFCTMPPTHRKSNPAKNVDPSLRTIPRNQDWWWPCAYQFSFSFIISSLFHHSGLCHPSADPFSQLKHMNMTRVPGIIWSIFTFPFQHSLLILLSKASPRRPAIWPVNILLVNLSHTVGCIYEDNHQEVVHNLFEWEWHWLVRSYKPFSCTIWMSTSKVLVATYFHNHEANDALS